MPSAAQAFLQQQPMVLVGSIGTDGQVWASLLTLGASKESKRPRYCLLEGKASNVKAVGVLTVSGPRRHKTVRTVKVVNCCNPVQMPPGCLVWLWRGNQWPNPSLPLTGRSGFHDRLY